MARETTFKFTKDNGTEYPARFKDSEIKIYVPESLEEFKRDRLDPSANADDVVMGFINGQGVLLTLQKDAKEYLNRFEAKPAEGDTPAREEVDVATAIAATEKYIAERRFGAPRVKGEGKTGKVAKAEAKAAQAETKANALAGFVLTMYRGLNRSQRKTAREDILAGSADHGITAEQLDAVDAEG